MRYTAKLVGVQGLERQEECFGSSLHFLRNWAWEIVKKYPQGRVEIWEQKLVLVESIEAEDTKSDK